jgi:hypothetical protein
MGAGGGGGLSDWGVAVAWWGGLGDGGGEGVGVKRTRMRPPSRG